MTLALLFRDLYWLWVASEGLLVVLTRTSRRAGSLHDRGSLFLLWGSILAAISLSSWFAETHPHNLFPGAAWVRIAIILLLIAGLAIRWTAIVSLGASFSVNVAIHPTQAVHRTGLFRLARHPSYTGLLLIFLAVGLSTRNWIALALMLLPTTAALLYRIHVEEAALTQAFGAQYRNYSRVTKRLIPGIY